VKIQDVKGADVNPKQHDIGTLHQSIERFGFVAPLIRNETTGKLVGGHGRIETLRQKYQLNKEDPPKGIKVDEELNWLVPVVTGIEFQNDDEADAYLVADNRLVELGGWDIPDLKELLEGVIVKTGTLDGVGYDAEDLQNLLEDVEAAEEEIKDIIDDPLSIKVKFENSDQRDDFLKFLKWLSDSSDLNSDGARLSEFTRNIIE
tara:strand:- start:328 stop:939 length:612 start_codon:yes stop_codon:yes gene_type:complete